MRPMRRLLGLLTVLLLAGVAQAGTVARCTKTCGTVEFATENTAGCTFIKDSEVDCDFDAVVSTLNALDHTNLTASAGILGTQLSGSAAILGSQLAASAGIVGTQLSTTAEIVGTQLAGGAAVHAFGLGTANIIAAGSAPETVVTVSPITTRTGGLVILGGSLALTGRFTSATPSIVTLRTFRDAAQIAIVSFSLSNPTATGILDFAIPTPLLLDLPAAGAHTYSVSCEIAGIGGGFFSTNGTNPGNFFAVELS